MWYTDPQWKWLSEMQVISIKEIFKRAFTEKRDVTHGFQGMGSVESTESDTIQGSILSTKLDSPLGQG